MPESAKKKTRILIVGAGFGGTYAAMRLDKTLAKRADCEVTLVDSNNFILFTPMLHEVAASDLDPSDIINPIRKLLKRATFLQAVVESIDLDARSVVISFGIRHELRTLEYDHLLIGMGSDTRFFDEQTEKYSMQLKTVTDAFFLRNRMIGALEVANLEQDADEQKRMLTFVVAGGGFAGVETAGAMNDFLREAVRYYPRLEEHMVRLIVAHHGEVLLPEFDRRLGQYTADRLREADVEVRLKTGVKSYDGKTVTFEEGEPIVANTLVWTAGVAPGKVIQGLPLKKEKGRIVVDEYMRSVDRPEVWAVGDAASVPDAHTGKAYPATAQTAIRQGPAVARNIEAVVVNNGRLKPFKFKMLGQLAAIGRHRGTAQVFGLRFSGFIAWFMWRTIYLAKLPRLEKKIRVGVAWALDLIFSRDIVQVITIADIRRVTAFGIRNHLGPNDAGPPKEH